MFPVITTNRKQSALSDFSRWLFTDSDHHTGNSKPELKRCYGARFHCDLRQLAAYGTVLLLICFTFQSHHICKASQPDDEATDSEMDRGCSTVFVLLHPTTKMNLWQQIAARFWSNSDKKTLFFHTFFLTQRWQFKLSSCQTILSYRCWCSRQPSPLLILQISILSPQ